MATRGSTFLFPLIESEILHGISLPHTTLSLPKGAPMVLPFLTKKRFPRGSHFTNVSKRFCCYSPICPFITEAIWRGIYSQSTIHKELFPSPHIWSKEFVKYGKELVEFNSLV